LSETSHDTEFNGCTYSISKLNIQLYPKNVNKWNLRHPHCKIGNQHVTRHLHVT